MPVVKAATASYLLGFNVWVSGESTPETRPSRSMVDLVSTWLRRRSLGIVYVPHLMPSLTPALRMFDVLLSM